MVQNIEQQDYKNLLNKIYAAMGTAGKKKAIAKFGTGVTNLEHTWEAYHFTGFIKETFEENYPSLMSDFYSLLIDLEIGAYREGFRKRPSAKGFTDIKVRLLYKGVVRIRCIKDLDFTERDLLLEFLLFCQKPFISKNGTIKSRVMSIFYGEEPDSDITIKQNDPALIEKAQSRLREEIERLKNYSVNYENTQSKGDEQDTDDLSVINIFTEDLIAYIRKTVEPLPGAIQKDLRDKINKQEIQITELKALVSELQKRIDELLSSDYVTDEIKSLVEAGEIDEAEIKVDQIVKISIKDAKEQQGKLGEYFYQQGKIKELKLKYKEAYEAFKQAINCQLDNIEYLHSAASLGIRIASHEEAQQFLNTSLKLAIKKYGENHLHSANSYNNLALILNSQGRYDEAESLYQKSHDIFRHIFGDNHSHTVASYNNLAMNFMSQGKYDKAEFLYHKSLEIFRNIFGENHPNTALGYSNLASILNAQGRHDEAEPLHQKSLNIRQRFHPKNHPDIADGYNNLAINFDARKRYDEAEPLYHKSLDINQRIFGEDHPSTAASYNNLAMNLEKQEKYKEAESLYHKSLDINQRIFGENHLNTETSYCNLALCLNDQKKYGRAEPFYRKSLEICLSLFGEDHQQTIGSYNNLISNLNSQKKYDEAEPLYRKILDLCLRIFGEEHPHTATGYNNLASNLKAQEKHDEAEPLYRNSLDICLRILGDEHPNTMTCYNNLASNLSTQEKHDEAEPFYRKSHELLSKNLGENHPATKAVLSNWQKDKS